MNDDLDFYEVLEISPNATQDTIDRMFRFLAQRYHPDRSGIADHSKFDLLVRAYNVLREPEKRTVYDIQHKKNSEYHWHLVEDAGDIDGFENDVVIQARILSVMYIKRKRDSYNPGLGNMQLERMTGCPQDILVFHLWYLREKGWILRLDDGLLAITAEGVDKALADHQTSALTKNLITNQQQDTIHL